ncbi:unnamed protein product [Linum tenue]|uniref:Uncharacterized protein n=1 Tax=Linum tenue TaxID=586396 RepID=A0AAV0P1G7_9ROSI|nr:unnamed protein product [Linum tenue]
MSLSMTRSEFDMVSSHEKRPMNVISVSSARTWNLEEHMQGLEAKG